MNEPTQQLTVVQHVCTTIASPEFRQKIAEALPPEVSVDRFVRTTLTAIQLKPEICEADRQSLYNSVIQAAQQKLMPDGREGAIVLYNAKNAAGQWVKKAQFQPMVAGIIKRFGEVGILAYAVSVHEFDKIEIWNDDTGQHVKHSPEIFGERGELRGVFAVARTSDGRTYVETMTMPEILRVMAASKSKDRDGNPVGPWKDWFDRMAQKSALHRLGRRVPMVSKADEAIRDVLDADRELYDLDAPRVAAPETAPAAPQARPTRPRALAAVTGPELPQEPAEAVGEPAGGPDDDDTPL